MNLKVAILPLDVELNNPRANLKSVASAMAGMVPGTDVVVLPELFTTGFLSEPEQMRQVAEKNDGVTMSALQRLSAQHGCAIAGSCAAKNTDAGENIYNRAFFVEPGGDITFYDKHHLFTPSHEAEIFTAGVEQGAIIRYRGWNIRVIVCYDLRFPAWCRNVDGAYDLLICPANWGGARNYAFKHLLIGRAIENQAYVVGANRCGADAYGDYPHGMSLVVNYKGEVMQDKEVDGMVYADLDRDRMMRFRDRFPALPDADKFIIKN